MTVTTSRSLTSSPPPAPFSREVVGLRVHTRAEVTPTWVRDCVLPVWDAARAGGRHLVALRRGWLGGPHVDVVGVGPGGTSVPWSDLSQSVDAGPAPSTPLDPADYLDRARVRGRLEHVPPPYLPLHGHGVIVPLRRTPAEGAPLAALRELTDAVLAPAVVRSVRRVADRPEHAATTVLDVLTCLAEAHVLGAGYGTFSLRSHAEALVAQWSPDGELRRQFLTRYALQRDPITARVALLLSGDGGGDVSAWRGAIAYGRGVVDEAVRRGELTNALVDAVASGGAVGEASPAPAPANPGAAAAATDHPDTPFHRTVYGSGATAGAGEWFAGYRFVVNSVYTQLPLLDVSPLARAYGCWAVSEAVDDVLGQSWTDRLAGTAQPPAGDRTTPTSELPVLPGTVGQGQGR